MRQWVSAPSTTAKTTAVSPSLKPSTQEGGSASTEGVSILMDVLASSPTTETTQLYSETEKTETTEYLQNCQTSSAENTCLDNNLLYLVIIIGLVISNCILSCLTVQKR